MSNGQNLLNEINGNVVVDLVANNDHLQIFQEM